MNQKDNFTDETPQFSQYVPQNRLIHRYVWGNKTIQVKTGLIEYEPLESLVLFEYSKRLLITPDRIAQYSESTELMDEIAAHVPIEPPFEIRLFDNRERDSKLRVNFIWRIISTKSLKDLTSDEFAAMGRALLRETRIRRIKEIALYAFENNDRLNSHLLHGMMPLFSPRQQMQSPNDHIESLVFVNRDNVNYHLGRAILLYIEPEELHSSWTHPDVDPTQHIPKKSSTSSTSTTTTTTTSSKLPSSHSAGDMMDDSFSAAPVEETPSAPIFPFTFQQKRIHISVASFNVLAQSRTDCVRHQCPPHFLNWAHRKVSILNTIRQMLGDSDILCLQGVERHQFLSIFPTLKHQYNYFYSQSASAQFAANSLAVLYNKHKYTLLEKKESLVKNSNDIFQCVVLESTHHVDAKSGRKVQLMVTNVMLSDGKNQEMLQRTKDIVDTMERLLDQNVNRVPYLVCGLLVRHKSVRDFLSSGVLDAGIVYEDQRDDSFYNETPLRHRLKLNEVGPSRRDSSVWFSNEKLSVNGVLQVESGPEPIPNQMFGSDSLPIGVEFEVVL